MEQQTLTEITTLTISKLISVIQNKYFITGAIVGGCFIYQYVSPKSFGTLSNKETNFQSQLTFEDLNFLKFLNKSKEYLLIGNINESINVLKNSSFDDIDINQWIDDASDLYNSREKLESLESILLEIIGKDVY